MAVKVTLTDRYIGPKFPLLRPRGSITEMLEVVPQCLEVIK